MICGVDEAGRGPWAGPVCGGAVILDPNRPIQGLADSKKLSSGRREALAQDIETHALAHGLGWASAAEIDALNIRQATHLAMRRAIEAMGIAPEFALVDGNDLPADLPCPGRTVIKGDQIEPCISAASILAKTARDAQMIAADARFPGYGFADHKGYGTAAHTLALKELGPCELHRHSFAPVAKALRARASHA